MELVQLGARTYYFSGMFRVGVYVLNADETRDGHCVCLIESGLNAEVAAEMAALLQAKGFRVTHILNTHYHADHCGGNHYFKERYNCEILATEINAALMSHYDICPAIVWGSQAIKEISNNYFYTDSTPTTVINEINLPDGLTLYNLPGHCISMVGVKTSDNVLFLGDALVGEQTIQNHKIYYLYDVAQHLQSLDKLKTLSADWYVPYHADPLQDITKLTAVNRDCVCHIIDFIKDRCGTPRTLEELFKLYYQSHGYTLNMYKYVVEQSVFRSYLTYLYNTGAVTTVVEDCMVKWVANTQ